jgi:hypothetical protein
MLKNSILEDYTSPFFPPFHESAVKNPHFFIFQSQKKALWWRPNFFLSRMCFSCWGQRVPSGAPPRPRIVAAVEGTLYKSFGKMGGRRKRCKCL